MSVEGTIFNIQKFCIHDGEGIRTTVFVKGCPLRCIWCHNPESQSRRRELIVHPHLCTACGRCINGCDGGGRAIKVTSERASLSIDRAKCTLCGNCAEACFSGVNELCGRTITADDAFAAVMRDKIFYDTSNGGMTISGGEPSAQPDFTLELLRLAKENGISSAMETCGYGPREFFAKAAELGCEFLFDLKCLRSERHAELTGVNTTLILSNLEMLFDAGASVVLRLPMIPGVNDTEADIDAAADYLRDHAGKYRFSELMAYHNLGVSKERGLGRSPALEIPNAGTDDKKRWIDAFAERGVTVKCE